MIMANPEGGWDFFPHHFLGAAISRSKVKLLEVNPQVVVTSVQQA